MKSLTNRLKAGGATTDYDLSKEPFVAYVPANYDAQKPMGLLVLILYKATGELPHPLLPELAEANMALIVCKDLPAAWWQRAGLALDAAHNMELQYSIDRRRVYLFGSWDKDESGKPVNSTERLGLNYPEVFSGLFVLDAGSFARINLPKIRRSIDPVIPPPADQALPLAKVRPLVLATYKKDEYKDHIAGWFSQIGFKHVHYVVVTFDDWHYPINKTGWLPGILKFMDAATSDLKLPTVKPPAMITNAPSPPSPVIAPPPPVATPAANPPVAVKTPAPTAPAGNPPPAVAQSPAASQPAGSVKTGEFQITLTNRGANSAPAALAKRLGMRPEECKNDYDLAKMPLVVYVPPNYDPAAPPGLFVFLHLARFPEVATSLKPLLDEMHLIFVSPVEDPLDTWQDAGLLLNIADEMQARYAINKSRIYLMEGQDPHFLTFAMSDVYTGFISLSTFAYPGTIHVGTKQMPPIVPADSHVPDAELMKIAKSRAFFFAMNPTPRSADDLSRPNIVGHMYQQGFSHVASLGSPQMELAYPHIHHTFLRPALMFLDTGQAHISEVKAGAEAVVPPAPTEMVKPPVVPAAPVVPPAPVHPAAPAPSPADLAHEQATRLLKVARLYIDAKEYNSARSKLNELIKKYPQDADAATARDLLGPLPQP
jgi:hypothetical protein